MPGASASEEHHPRRMTIVMAASTPGGIIEAIDSTGVLLNNRVNPPTQETGDLWPIRTM
jgi:hypothetical protein